MIAVVAAGFMVKDILLNAEWLREAPAATVVLLRVLVLAVFYAAQVAVLAHLAARRALSFGEAFRLRRGGAWRSAAVSAGLVGALLVGTRAAATLYAALAHGLGFDPPGMRWNADLSRVFGAGLPGFALTVALVVLVGPLVEEVVFRGVILGAVSSRLGPWPAIVASALLFSVYHFTAWLLVPSFVLGVACGWLAARRPTLIPAVALHSLYNAVAVAAAFYVASR
ncbi:MAG: CPBP family intramembrane metalloprotease [Coriobacteriia bacterium]|nr:CPBP family intramembrane metalloprotease [Coriobacteriia bacterium]